MNKCFAYYILFALLTTSCIHPEVGYRKSVLLDPLMDPSKTASMAEYFQNSTLSSNETGTQSNIQTSSGSCPTCGT